MATMSTVIDRHRDAILARWTKGVRQATFAEGLTSPELSSMIPTYLALLGRQPAGDVKLTREQHQLIESHLSNRLRQGSVLNEILTEFAVLGSSVLHCLDAERDAERPSIAEVADIFAELSLTCAAVTRIFTEHMLEDEQSEKRTIRLLHEIGGDAIARGHAMPVAAQMDKAVALIMKAMNAQAISLQFSNRQSGDPVLASAGDAAGALERFSDGVEPSSQSSQPAVNDGLRAAGIRAVLSVGLSSRHLLRGALRVGINEERRFTASEVRRLQGLADALAVHLENVGLNAALREHADAIAAESELRERFVSILVHDLSGPLASARACARKLVAERIDGAGAGAAKIAEHLARMEEMVGGLVDAHRIRCGHRLPMVIEECDLGVLARSVVDELRAVHGDRFLLRGDGRVRGMWNAEQLRRAISNLVINAVQHGDGTGAIGISVARRSGTAELSVHNHGPEIGREDRARLMRPFSPSRPGSGAPRGWGLGLTLVWGCVEAHGGRLELDSAADQGTTFKLSIPFDARPYADAD